MRLNVQVKQIVISQRLGIVHTFAEVSKGAETVHRDFEELVDPDFITNDAARFKVSETEVQESYDQFLKELAKCR